MSSWQQKYQKHRHENETNLNINNCIEAGLSEVKHEVLIGIQFIWDI